jgi:hypothetical protein
VRPRRLELPWGLIHSDLNAARLPVSPRPQYIDIILDSFNRYNKFKQRDGVLGYTEALNRHAPFGRMTMFNPPTRQTVARAPKSADPFKRRTASMRFNLFSVSKERNDNQRHECNQYNGDGLKCFIINCCCRKRYKRRHKLSDRGDC